MSKLIDITKNITDGVHGDCDNEENSGYYFISVKDMEDYRINYDNARQITHKDYLDAHKRTKLEKDDVLFANSGHTIGKMLRVKEGNVRLGKTTFQKSVAILKQNLDVINETYFYYLIKHYTEGLKRTAVGSAQKNLLLDDIRNFTVSINHILKNQKKSVHILELLDTKIELNDSINTELEAMAKILYDYWFVQFDFPNVEGKPYKSSGGKMVWNEELKREIPEGWDCGTISNIVNNIKESTDAGANSNLSYVPIDNLPKKKLVSADFSPNIDAKSSLVLFKKYDILLGAMRVYFHRVCLAIQEGITRTTTFVLRPKEDYLRYYSLFTINTTNSISFATVNSKGSTMPYTFWENGYEKFEIVIPPKEHLFSFNKIIAPILEKSIVNEIENQKLSELRDWLLPMLMNGQVKVN